MIMLKWVKPDADFFSAGLHQSIMKHPKDLH